MPVCKICGGSYLTINGLAKTFNICRNHVLGPFWCGSYYPKNRYRELYWTDPLTKNIISNKRGLNDASVYLCELMYKKLLKIIEEPIHKEFPQYRLQLDDLLVIPVPNHESDRQKPALNLARNRYWFLAHAPAFPVLIAILPHDSSRKQMSPEERYEFDLKKYQIAEKITENNDVIRNKNILLIDDLYVHGSTVNICSSILLENGAKRVIQLCAGKSQ